MKFKNLKIGTKITLAFMLFGLLTPLIGGSIVYNRVRDLLGEEIYAHLETVVISRKNHIQTFLRQNKIEEIKKLLAARKQIPELNKIVLDRSGLGKTGEIYLVNKNFLMLTPSRFKTDTFLKQKVDTLNSRNCFSMRKHMDRPGEHVGHKAVEVFPDYRGVSVLGAHAYIPEMDWALLAEIDAAEALAPLRALRNNILALMLIVPFLASLIGFYFSRIISNPIVQLKNAAAELGGGKLDTRVRVDSKDEVGELGNSFNKMGTALKEIFARAAIASKEMSAVVMNVGRGDYSVRAKLSEKNDDFDALAMGINMMIDDIIKSTLERKRAEEALRESEGKFRAIFDSAVDGILVADPKNKKFHAANKMMCQMVGYSSEEFQKLGIMDIHPKKDIPYVVEQFEKQAKKEKGLATDIPLQRKDGSIFYTDINSTSIKLDSETYLLGIFRDITERKRAEEAIFAEKERLLVSLRSIGDGLIATDQEGKVTILNKVAEDLTGWKQEEALGRPALEVFNIINEQTRQRTEDPIAKVLKLGIIIGLANHSVLISKDGTEHPIADSGAPIHDNSGKVIGTILVFRDITELRRVEKLKDEFVSVVSHELRTPLTIVKEGVGQVLEGLLGSLTEEQKKYLTTVINNVDRLGRIINNMLDISRIEAGKLVLKKGIFDVVRLAKEICGNFKGLAAEKGLQIRKNFQKKKVEIFADRDELAEVFTNLMGNSIKFTKKGYVEIAVADKGDTVECSVSDTGIGIEKESLPKVFNKFEQFGRVSGPGEKGTGLGLSIAKGLVELHNGKIWVGSELGKWTKFTFTIPKKQNGNNKETV